jgi:hypothetical protein
MISLRTIFLTLLLGGMATAQLAPRHHLDQALPSRSSAVFAQSMALFDESYDPEAHLVLHPNDGGTHVRGRYMVRESSWYALGLLMRGRIEKKREDAPRALSILQAVLDEQYLDTKVKWYGTFKRSPEELGPQVGANAFGTYDPNWRQFIGTTFEIILIEFGDTLPAELRERMYRSIDAAVAGEMHDGRLLPSYSNIALMYGALWDFAGEHDRNSAWQHQSAAWMDSVYALYKAYGTMNEYNAPTYFGVDIYGLALWREYGSNATMRQRGNSMEAGMWNDLADHYQASLRNVVGPYDRSYGMDMTQYVTPTGVWLSTVLDRAVAPLPASPTLGTYQVADMWFAPQIVLLGTHIPNTAMRKFRHFSGSTLVKRRIDAKRVATSRLGQQAMWGGELTSLTKDTGITQFHPVTVHWLMPSGEIGWVQLTHSPMIDATADSMGMSIVTDGEVVFKIHAGKQELNLLEKTWLLPGMKVNVQSDSSNFSMVRDEDGTYNLTYTGIHRLRMDIHPITQQDTPPLH